VKCADADSVVGEGVGNTYVSDSLASDDLQMLEIDEVWTKGGEQGVGHTIALAVRQSHTFPNRERAEGHPPWQIHR
jgi:hypothetical protein